MDETNDMDLLDRQLREAAPYLDDDGFTRRVLQKLPVRRPRLQAFRASILLGASVIASMVAYLLSDDGRFVSEGMVRMASMSPLMILFIAMGLGVVVLAGGVAAAGSRDRGLRILG